jgi:pimeloyl-ACP methyl ester carboxylesterase
MVTLMDQGLHYEVNGAGPPLLLIHGTGSSLRVWDPVVYLLAAHRTVIAVDLPGFGFSPTRTSGPPPTPAGYARVLAELLRELGYDRAHVAGNSVGGWTALEAAKRLSWSEDFGKGSGQVYSLGGGCRRGAATRSRSPSCSGR